MEDNKDVDTINYEMTINEEDVVRADINVALSPRNGRYEQKNKKNALLLKQNKRRKQQSRIVILITK